MNKEKSTTNINNNFKIRRNNYTMMEKNGKGNATANTGVRAKKIPTNRSLKSIQDKILMES